MSATPISFPDEMGLTPVANLCNKLFRDSLARGVAVVELVGAGSLPAVNQFIDGIWQPYMQLPAPVFAAVAQHLRHLGGVADTREEAVAVIHMPHEGRQIEIGLTATRSGDGSETLTLQFPAKQPATGAAT